MLKKEEITEFLRSSKMNNLNDILMDNTKNKIEETQFLGDLRESIMTTKEGADWFLFTGNGKSGEDKLLELAKDRPDLRSQVYHMLSHIYEDSPDVAEIDTLGKKDVQAMLYARASAFWANGQDKDEKMSRFNLLKKKIDRRFPEITKKELSFGEAKVKEIDALTMVFDTPKAKKLMGAETSDSIYMDYLQDLSHKGYYMAQNTLALKYIYSGNFAEANKVIDMMRDNKIRVAGHSGLEGYEETLDALREQQRKKNPSQGKQGNSLESRLAQASANGLQKKSPILKIRNTQYGS